MLQGFEASADAGAEVTRGEETFTLQNGAVVIAAITSCTNTSNPSVMLAAGLVAKKAVEKGLRTKPWVKTSLAPGSQVVTEYLEASGLIDELDTLRFNLVGYGCTTLYRKLRAARSGNRRGGQGQQPGRDLGAQR